jgi:GNAT superfamily N-acetyltransferase
MRYHIKKVDDTDEMKSIHKMAFGGDSWPGDDHEFWVAYDQGGAVCGFASAVLLQSNVVYLSRSAVVLQHRGRGLQKKLINHRLKWAKAEGAEVAVTYVQWKNFASLMNLLHCGFRFTENRLRGYGDFALMYKGVATEEQLRRWCVQMLENP